MSRSIAHVSLVVRDYDEAIDWFTRCLAFQLIEDMPLENGKRWVTVGPAGRSGTSLLLARAAATDQERAVGNQTGGRVFLFLHTDDFARDYAAMSAAGVQFVEQPRREPYGQVVVFQDLYGNRWDLVERKQGGSASDVPRGDDVEVRVAPSDLAVEIMREVAQWCIDSGKPMWRLEELSAKALLRHPPFEEDFRVAWVGGQPAAAMILQWHDAKFWPEVRPGESGFIHKLCVRRAFAGRHLSQTMVDHAKRECRRRNASHLRLDTSNKSTPLCALYEGMGFVKVGRRQLDGRDYALYRLKLGDP